VELPVGDPPFLVDQGRGVRRRLRLALEPLVQQAPGRFDGAAVIDLDEHLLPLSGAQQRKLGHGQVRIFDRSGEELRQVLQPARGGGLLEPGRVVDQP
jgi:hypothetical protein